MVAQYVIPWLLPLLWTIILSYSIFTFLLTFYWSKLPPAFPAASGTSPFISVIIPVRNEEANIGALLADLDQQTFPADRFEVLVIDDASTDNTRQITNICSTRLKCKIRLIVLDNIPTSAPKKRAIETAMREAVGSLIVTTDGDCRVGPGWLAAIADCHAATGAKLISGPVTFTKENTLTDHLQTVEFSSLIGSGASAISAGFPSLCNGANLAYEKSTFEAVGGYDGVRQIASGDDEFLMHKIAAIYPGSIQFLKNPDAIVRTEAHREWALFFRQRKRWASKWKHYQSKTPLVLALYIFTCNLSLIIASVTFLSGEISGSTLAILWLVKCAPEWIFLGSVLGFLKKSGSILVVPLTQIIYPFYVCLFGLAAQKPEYDWKGRKLV